MKKEIQVIIPETPNFLRLAISDNGKQEPCLPIECFTDAELLQIGNEWIKDLTEKANRNRSAKINKQNK